MSRYNEGDEIYIKKNKELFKKYHLQGAYDELIRNEEAWEYNKKTQYFKGKLFSDKDTQINIKRLSGRGPVISISKKGTVFNDKTIDSIFEILDITKDEPYEVIEHSESKSRSRSRSHSDNAKLFTSKQVRAILYTIANCSKNYRKDIENLKKLKTNGEIDDRKDNKIQYTFNDLIKKAVSICKSEPHDKLQIRKKLEENLNDNKIKFEDIPSEYQRELLKLKDIRDKYGQTRLAKERAVSGPREPSPQEIAEELISNLNIVAEAVKTNHITYNSDFINTNCYNSGSVAIDFYYYDLLLLYWYNPTSVQFETLINLLNNADHPFVSNKVHLIKAIEFKTRDYSLVHGYLLSRLYTILKLDGNGNGDKISSKKRYIDAFQSFYKLETPLYISNRLSTSYLYLNKDSHNFYSNKSTQRPKPDPAADPVCYICGRTIHKQSDNNTDHIVPITLSYITGTINFPLAYSPTHRICNQSKSEKIPLHLNEITGIHLKALINETLKEEPNRIGLILDHLESQSPEVLQAELKKRGYTNSSWWKFWGGSQPNSSMNINKDKEQLFAPSTPSRKSSYKRPLDTDSNLLDETIHKLQNDFTKILKTFNNNIINSPNNSHIDQLFTIIQVFSLIHFLILQKDCIEYSINNDTYDGGKNKQQGGNNIKERINTFLSDITPSAATQYGPQIWPLNKQVDFFITRMVIYYHYSKTLVDAHKLNMNKEASYSLYNYYTAAIENLSKNITVTVKPDANDF